MRGLALRVAIIAVILGGAWIFRDVLSGNANDLAVGDCFDDPETASGKVEDVQHHRCTDPHNGEVIFIGGYEPATGTYPSTGEFTDFVSDRCTGAFFQYTGRDYNTTEELAMGAYWPTSESWSDGGRKVICYVVNTDGSPSNGSIKKAS